MQKKKKKSIHKNIFLLGFASLFNDFSSEMITPIMPLLITQLGGAGIAIGLIGGMREGFANILRFIFGYLSDKKGNRKIFIYAGYATSAFFKMALIIARSWYFIFGLVGLERIGKALRGAPRDALISFSIPKRTGLGFGIHRAMDTAGAMLGSIVVFFLLWQWQTDLKTIITVAALVAILSLIPLFAVKEENHHTTHQHLPPLQLSNLSTSFKLFTAIAGIFSFANLSYMFFMLRAQEVFPHSPSGSIPILLYVLFNISYTIVSVPLGLLSDKIGRWKLLVFGYALFSLITLGFIFAQTFAQLAILFICYGIVFATIKINHKAFVSDITSKRLRATAIGTFDAITGTATLAAGAIVGVLWQHINYTIAFSYTSITAALAVLLLLVFKKHLDGNQ